MEITNWFQKMYVHWVHILLFKLILKIDFMNTKQKLGFASYYIAIILIILFGGMYMFKPSFMPYHADIIQGDWENVLPSMQKLIRALMIAVGGVTVGVGIILGIFTLKFNKTREPWVGLYITISGIIASLLISVAPIYVVVVSDSVPPLYFPVVIITLLLLGYFLTRKK